MKLAKNIRPIMIIFSMKAAEQTTELLQFSCIYRMFRCAS